MRKVSLFLISVLLLFSLTTSADAAGSMSLTPSKTTCNRGDEITITIKLSGMPAAKSGVLEVSCGTGIEWIDVSSNKDFNVNKKLSEKRCLFFGMSAVEVNGSFATLKFKVKNDASFASKSIKVSLQLGDAKLSSSVNITVACKHSFGSSSKVDGTYHQRTCSICKYVEKNKHNYDNGCDSKCNTCGATRSVSHQFKTEWSSTDKYHYHACKICGDWKDTAQHTPGDAATEQSAQTCTVCNRVLSAQLEHVHDKLPDIQKDETGHWYNCSKCEDKADFQEHTYEFACSDTCTTCGYVREVTHTPGKELLSDGTGHWFDCQVCHGKADFHEHSGDITSQSPKCEACGYAMVHFHVYAEEEWTGDDIFHWHACACGAKKGEESHSWNDGEIIQRATWNQKGKTVYTCDGCHAQMEAITMETLPTLFPWMVACGVLAIAVLVMGISLILISVKIKKHGKGKYATV